MDDERDPSTNPGLSRRGLLSGFVSVAALAALGVPFRLDGETLVIPNSGGFLLVDLKKCQGCGTCMMACALAHTGVASNTLARIQIVQDPWLDFPNDIFMAACRQCADAPCVMARCPYTPARLQWDSGKRKSQKCDLCADTPFLGEKGGPGGTQTCVKVCPMNAIAFTSKMPDQASETSYEANLRGKAWKRLGMTTE